MLELQHSLVLKYHVGAVPVQAGDKVQVLSCNSNIETGIANFRDVGCRKGRIPERVEGQVFPCNPPSYPGLQRRISLNEALKVRQ